MRVRSTRGRAVALVAAATLVLSACDAGEEDGGTSADPVSSAPSEPRTTLGVTDDEIRLVYYWRGGEGTGRSQFFGDQETLVPEEAEAFVAYVNYLNEHSGTGATFLGFPFDLHGRTMTVEVLEGGTSPEQFLAVAERIAVEIEPFATVAGEGSISTYACPRFAEVGVFSISTLAFEYDLFDSTDGYCLPAFQAWETQVELVAAYLEEQVDTPYVDDDGVEHPRVYGIVHTEHPPLVRSLPRLRERLEATGARIAEVATLPQDLTVAQQQTGNVISRMRAAGVNTLVIPDAGVPLTLTRAGTAQQYHPDYVVWPCSGMDLSGMGRLFPGDQWERAEGVTCYAPDYNVDIARDGSMDDAEWYRHYREGSSEDREPPLNAELVYFAMFPLVVGVTNAGPDLTADSFVEGLDGFEPYRYSVRDGRTDDEQAMLIRFGEDRGLLGDGARVRWDDGLVAEGSPLPGGYEFLPVPRLQPGGRS